MHSNTLRCSTVLRKEQVATKRSFPCKPLLYHSEVVHTTTEETLGLNMQFCLRRKPLKYMAVKEGYCNDLQPKRLSFSVLGLSLPKVIARNWQSS